MLTIDAQSITEIVESIFLTMMDLELFASDAAWVHGQDRLTSSVYVEGDWNAAVSLECNHDQACTFAGRLLGMDAPAAVDDDVRDAVGELANMIGGNIKSTMTGDVRLSMPSVVDGNQYEVRVCGCEVENKVVFRFQGGDFRVTVSGRRNLPMKQAAVLESVSVAM